MQNIFSRKSIREALKSWHSLEKLGKHPLASLEIVKFKRQTMKQPDTPIGYGLSLRNVMAEALESLKPGTSGEPMYDDENWTEFLLLRDSFIHKKPRSVLVDMLRYVTSNSMYHRIQNHGLDKFGAILQQWEGDHYKLSPNDENEQTSPFLAPPPLPFNLVDRYLLLQHLKARLLGSENLKSVSLYGLPGVGKTSIATALAYDQELLGYFHDGILWADLGKNPSLLTTLDRWARSLGISTDELSNITSKQEKARRIHELIGMHQMLLVIDDVWDIESALTFQVGGPNCAYLITTRFPNIAKDFAEEGAINVSELSSAGGFTLFSKLAPYVTELAPEESQKLVGKVSGLPLAIVLLARYMRKEAEKGWETLQFAFKELTSIEKRNTLSQLQHPVIPHPSLKSHERISLPNLINVSVSSLNESIQRALFTFSVFAPKPNTFSLEAVLAISNASVREVETITESGLIEIREPNRYTIHQTISDYLKKQISSENYQILVHSHAEYYLEYVQKHHEQWKFIEVELPQLREAWQAINQTNNEQLILNYSIALLEFQKRQGLWLDRVEWCLQGVAAAKKLNLPLMEGNLLNAIGWSLYSIGKYEDALEYLSQALLLRHDIGDKRGEAETNNDIGVVYENLGDFQESLKYLHHSLSLWEPLENNEKDLASVLNNIGVTYYSLSQFNEAIKYYTRAMQLHRRMDNLSGEGNVYSNLATAYRLLGKLDKSLEYHKSALQIKQEIGETIGIASTLNGIGATYRDLGDYDSALKYYQDCLSISRKHKSSNKEALALHNIGVLCIDLEEIELSFEHLEGALKIRREIRDQNGEAYTLSAIGKAYGCLNELKKGQQFVEESISIWRAIGNQYGETTGQLNLGSIYLRAADYFNALNSFKEAQEIAIDIKAQSFNAEAFWGIGQTLAKQGSIESAREQGYKSLEIFKIMQHRKAGEVVKWLEELE